MKISSTKKAAILASVLSGFVLGQSAEAANLGIVTASDYVTSHMGALQGSFIHSDDITAVKSVITGLNRDPAVYNTIDPITGKSSIYIRQYTYSTTNLQDSYAFDAQFDAQGDWWNDRAAGNTSGAVNAHDVARYNNFVYVASYDEGTVGVAEVVDSNGKKIISDQTAFTRDMKADLLRFGSAEVKELLKDSRASLHGEGVVIVNGSLYVMANCNPYGGYDPYSPSFLIKYVILDSGELSYDGYTTMGKNTDSVALNVYNNYILSTAIGGYQYYGAENSNVETSLNVAKINTTYDMLESSRKIELPENLYTMRNGEKVPKSEFRSLKVLPNGTAYVMTYNIGRAGKNVDVTVYQTTVSNLLSKNPQNWKVVYEQEGAPGWFGRLDAEYNTKRLWVQVGNKLNIYTDGATTPLSYGTSSFSNSAMYDELYTWDIIGTDIIPNGKLVELQLANGENKENTQVAVWKDTASNNISQIKNVGYKNIDTKDNLINLGHEVEGNLTNNVLAGIYAEGVATNVNANAGLQIQVENNIASPIGIFAGNNSSVKFTSNSNLDIITKSMDGGNTLTNAIWLDPSKVGGESINITAGDTTITMEGGYGGNGVAIQKADRWGENSKESVKGGKITINGDLNIKGKDNVTWGIDANPNNVISRFNNAGIFVDVNNSSVTVDGNVDMDVYGNGVTVNGKNSIVTITKGGSITVPTGTDYGYYTLAAYDGTINMNANGSANDVKLDGDIFALKGATINLGLATGTSYLDGVIDNGGTVNLILKNGATWINEANNTRYEQDNEDYGSLDDENIQASRVNTLTGGVNLSKAGVIQQDADSKDIVIGNLNGAIKVNYTSYADGNYADILGGSVKIDKAEVGSQIAMISTNNKGVSTRDITAVEAVLESLANKLYYTGTGSNLSAVALGLSEGLTSSSVTKTANINFNGTTGQGSLTESDDNTGTGDDISGIVTAPVHPSDDETANPDCDWKDNPDQPNGIVVDGTTGDKNYKKDKKDYQIQNKAENNATGVYVTDNKTLTLGNTKESKSINNLSVITQNTSSDGRTNAIWVDGTKGGTLGITMRYSDNNEKRSQCSVINVSATGGHGGNAIAITKNGNVSSDQGGTITINKGVLQIKGAANNQWGVDYNPNATNARENSTGILVEADNSKFEMLSGRAIIEVCGNGVTVDGENSSVILANGSCYPAYGSGGASCGRFTYYPSTGETIFDDKANNGSEILVAEGNENQRFYSLAAYKGSIEFGISRNLNYDDGITEQRQYTIDWMKKDGKIYGDMYLGGASATIDAGLYGENATFTGVVDNEDGLGNMSLYLVGGAIWNHVSTNGIDGADSYITTFRGTNYAKVAAAKIIQSANSGNIEIENYTGDTRVIYSYDESQPHKFYGGDIKIHNAAVDSKITLYTNYSTAINGNNLSYVMNSLAGKLYYLGYAENGETNLNAHVQIGEGLTASSINAAILKDADILDRYGKLDESIQNVYYDKDFGTLNAGIKFDETTGKGSLKELINNDEEDVWTDESTLPEDFVPTKDFGKDGAFTRPIYGVVADDLDFIAAKIREKGVYKFDKDISFNIDNESLYGGPYHKNISAAIIATGDLYDTFKKYKTVVDLDGHNLTITNNSKNVGSGASLSAIDRGILEITNPGDITIYEDGMGPCAGIFANGGGEVYIDNAATGSTVTITTSAGGGGYNDSYKDSGAGIKTMNGADGVRSKVVITGLVDIVADLNKCNNEALSAVASTIEVGGGRLAAINGAWCAIRAYGEFVSNNAAVVNVNVKKDDYGNITGAGDYKTTIDGDFVTNGGMGTLGYITVGLNGDESYWYGNYGDNRGYGVTQGQEGNVTLYMKNGADWTGFSDGEMNVTMEGEGTTWYGFNVAEREADAMGNTNGGLYLTLSDGAVWQNAITKVQTINNKLVDSKVYNFVGNGGYIDMTGYKTFIGKNEANHAAGSNGTSNQNTHIVENTTPQETGNLIITNYSGDTTIFYRRDDNDVNSVLGGTTTIKNASLGSKITLSTNNTGIATSNEQQVSTVLNNLAKKLYYTGYVDGERNLQGYVQITEGLTASEIGANVVQKGDIAFSSTDGQGRLDDGSVEVPPSDDDNQGGTTPDIPDGEDKPQDKPVEPEKVEKEFTSGISGDLASDETYKDLVNEDGALDFGKLEAAEGEVIGSVKIETEATTENNIVISSSDKSNPVNIDMAGLDLEVSGTTKGANKEAKGIEATNGAAVSINNAGNITIKANSENGSASAIYAQGTNNDNKATVLIHNAESETNAGGTVMLRAEGKGNVPVLNAGSHADVNITGKVDITNTNGNVAVSVGEGSTVAIGGGEIGDKDSVAIHVDGGKININADGKESVVINGKIVLGKAPAKTKMMMKAAQPKVVTTDISSIALTDKDSSFNDDVYFAGGVDLTANPNANNFAIAITDGATWSGNSTGGVDLTVLLDDSGVWTGFHEDEKGNTFEMQITNGAEWFNEAANDTTIDKLVGADIKEANSKEGFIRMNETDLVVRDYSGKTTFIYEHNAENKILGGNVNIQAAADGSIVNVRTNSIGTSNKDEVTKVLEALAAKMIAKDANGDVLSNAGKIFGEAQIAEGIVTSASALKVGNIDFTNGTGVLDKESITARYPDNGYIYGDSETAMMKGAKSAMASTVMMWRSESNDLLQRMGDVRLATEESGVWAKYYGGKYEMDAQNTNFSTNYKAYQVGYDKAVGNGWNVGVAVSHNEGDSRYDRGGEGEMTVTSLSVYGNKDYGDGRYLGLILKGSQLKNEYEVFNNDGYKLEGDFKTWGTSISAEYGKRIEKGNGFYFDPSVELTVGHVQGKDYTATMQVEQDDFNSIIGRVGFGIGQRTDKASYYAKLALAHEFGGDFDTHYTAEETKGTNIDFGDTWYEMQLGGTAKLSDNSLLYATYERSFGGDVTEKWRVDAGLRVTF